MVLTFRKIERECAQLIVYQKQKEIQALQEKITALEKDIKILKPFLKQ